MADDHQVESEKRIYYRLLNYYGRNQRQIHQVHGNTGDTMMVSAMIPWVWGVNGCASVISAILATILAIHLGFTVVIVLALGLNFISAVLRP